MKIINQTYPNGLRSLSVLSKDTQAVTVMFLVAVGSRHEEVGEEGLAHFVEHTIFKGTSKRPSSKVIGMEIESLGGSSNAFTSYEYTGYYIKAPAGNFTKTFDIISDMFQNSIFDENELNKEKGVIIEEIKMYEDRPTSKVSQIWSQNFFQDSKLGKEITGSIQSVSDMKRDKFFEFMKKHYYGENILIVVAGNADQSEIESLVEKHCMDIPNFQASGNTKKTQTYTDDFNSQPSYSPEKRIILGKDVQQTHVILGGKSFPKEHPDRYKLQVVNSLLAEGFGSRLFQVIRDELGLAYYIYSRLSSFREVGVFNVGMGVDTKRVDEAIDAVKKELREILDSNFTKEEFERAKNFLLGNIITDLESSEDIATFYGMQELLQKETHTIEDVKQNISSVNFDDVYDIASQVFQEDAFYTAILSPK